MAKLTNRQIEVITRAVKEQIKEIIFTDENKEAVKAQVIEDNAEFFDAVQVFNDKVEEYKIISAQLNEKVDELKELSKIANSLNKNRLHSCPNTSIYSVEQQIESATNNILSKRIPSNDIIEASIILKDLEGSSTLVADILEQLGFSE